MTYSVLENRDVRCAADVGRMAELGRFATEIEIYGAAVQNPDGKIFYRTTENAENLYRYIQRQRIQEQYYTPISVLREREKIPFELREAYVLDRKYTLLRQMKSFYEDSSYFEIMRPFFIREPNNNAVALLNQFRENLDGYFDDTSLQIFGGLVGIAYEGKVLSAEGYQKLEKWYWNIRKQMQNDPVVEDNIGRTFYGFGYLDSDETMHYIIDTQLMPIVYKRQEKILQGYCAGSITQKSYWFQQFNQLPTVRKAYQEWLMYAQDAAYFESLKIIQSLPGVIADKEQTAAIDKIKKYAEAKTAAAYYFTIWNKQ
ncbi:MAG: hypothetical protein J6J05_05285 [Peptococcaceae bacterium]|nr:hypothetical protein [Peptococcaceae bacterium]